eukprot:COSAG01_NODE_5427_length_4271_cov_2.486098_5_plen_121_part_00
MRKKRPLSNQTILHKAGTNSQWKLTNPLVATIWRRTIQEILFEILYGSQPPQTGLFRSHLRQRVQYLAPCKHAYRRPKIKILISKIKILISVKSTKCDSEIESFHMLEAFQSQMCDVMAT